jgi:hypothetical protein
LILLWCAVLSGKYWYGWYWYGRSDGGKEWGREGVREGRSDGGKEWWREGVMEWWSDGVMESVGPKKVQLFRLYLNF